MSWILGYTGNKNIINNIDSNPLHKFCNENMTISCGGPNETTFYSADYNTNQGWIVCGVGINIQGNGKILNKHDWETELSGDKFDPGTLDGHFIIIRWHNDKIEIFTDRLGLRDIYTAKYGNGFIFSTRPDWISIIVHGNIDFRIFGARWLLFNQISGESIISGVTRICGGTKAVIEADKIVITGNQWLPKINISNNAGRIISEDYYNLLKKIISLPISDNHSLSLSLSGGMDSRVILSYLLKYNSGWDAHTFGNIDNVDNSIAKRMASCFNFKHDNYYSEIPGVDDCIKLMKEYSAQTLVNNPASHVLQCRYYNQITKENNVIIDGGFGEIWRREFFKRLITFGRKTLLNKDINKIIGYTKSFRADIFTPEILNIMNDGCAIQFNNMLNELPQIEKNNIHNWVDLFAIKTRLRNYYGHEQAYVDGFAPSYMPFAQASLLEYLPALNYYLRKNGILFRNIIKQNNNKLTSFPLAKGEVIHPFVLNSLQSRAWSYFMDKAGLIHKDNTNVQFLLHLKEYILDIVNSKSTAECGFYDYNKVKNIVYGFYNNDFGLANQLDWWLSFELFRQGTK